MEATTDAIIRIVQSCTICYASANIKALETLGYAEHICNFYVISDSCFSGKISQVSGSKAFGYQMYPGIFVDLSIWQEVFTITFFLHIIQFVKIRGSTE